MPPCALRWLARQDGVDADSPVLVAFAIVGFVATLITLLWVVWNNAGVLFRKPRVRMEFRKTQGPSESPLLTCDFYNEPLSQWPFSFLNIKKQNIQEFSVMARLFDMNGHAICELDPALHDGYGRHSDTFPLPSSIYSLHWPIVCFDDIGPSVINQSGIQTYLSPDTYEVRILLHADEVDVRTMAQRFVAGVDASVFDWVGNPYQLSRTRLSSCIQRLRRIAGPRRHR